MPDSQFEAGWSALSSPEQYDTASLYQYLDGGADVVIEFGFDRLTFQRYIKQEQEIDLELYHMTCPEAALGLYLLKAGKETPSASLRTRNSVSSGQVLVVQGSYLGVTTILQGDSLSSRIALSLSQKLVSDLPEKKPVPLLDYLPRTGIISGTARIVRGALTTPPAIASARSLITRLCATRFAIAADYQSANGKIEHRLFVPFADSNAARTALDELRPPADSNSGAQNAGSTITITGASGDRIEILRNRKSVEVVVR